MSSNALVDIRDLRFAYDERPILEGISLTIPRGKLVAIMGGSGCGKTTLLRLIGGQLRPSAGEVWVDGQALHTLGRGEMYRLRRRMGMLFQFGALFTDMSVFDNVAFPLREHTDLTEAMIRDLVLLKLNAVGLARCGEADARRAVRRHGAARGAGPGDCPGSHADHV